MNATILSFPPANVTAPTADVRVARAAQYASEITRHRGSKYDEVKGARDSVIAARIRADVKAAAKAGQIPAVKYAVRTSTYSGGCTIRVEAIGTGYAHRSPEADALRAALEAIAAAYQRSESHVLTDYCATNFFTDVVVA